MGGCSPLPFFALEIYYFLRARRCSIFFSYDKQSCFQVIFFAIYLMWNSKHFPLLFSGKKYENIPTFSPCVAAFFWRVCFNSHHNPIWQCLKSLVAGCGYFPIPLTCIRLDSITRFPQPHFHSEDPIPPPPVWWGGGAGSSPQKTDWFQGWDPEGRSWGYTEFG